MRDAKKRRVLRKAADLIETHGWIQYALGSPVQGFCAMGAIRHVLKPNFSFRFSPFRLPEQTREVVTYVEDHDVDLEPRGLTFWNDQDGRTSDEVVALLRRVGGSG